MFDRDVVGDHDPIGRVVINVSNFRDNTVYLLNYSLHYDSSKSDDRGTISIRLRVEWKNKHHKTKRMMEKPPRKIFLNVSSAKSFHVVKYLCRGQVDLEKATVDSIKHYVNELRIHTDNLFYLLDSLFTVLLWRGNIDVQLSLPKFLLRNKCRQKMISWQDDDNKGIEIDNNKLKLSLWFPIRSMILFQGFILTIEHPKLIPGFFFTFVGLLLLRSMMTRLRHPIPWQRCKVSNI